MSLEMKDLDHVLKLAHLTISDADKPQFLDKLNGVLGYMKTMDQLDLENVSPSAYAHQTHHPLREDEVVKQDGLLLKENAPLWSEKYFEVPQIKAEGGGA